MDEKSAFEIFIILSTPFFYIIFTLLLTCLIAIIFWKLIHYIFKVIRYFNKNNWLYIITDYSFNQKKHKFEYEEFLRVSSSKSILQYCDPEFDNIFDNNEWKTVNYYALVRNKRTMFGVTTSIDIELDNFGRPVFPYFNGNYFANEKLLNKYKKDLKEMNEFLLKIK